LYDKLGTPAKTISKQKTSDHVSPDQIQLPGEGRQDGCEILQEQRRFQEVVLKRLATIELEVKEVKGLILAQDSSLPEFEGVPDLPVETDVQYHELCRRLQAHDSQERSKLIRVLSLIGGSNADQATRRILARLLGNELTNKMNFSGKNGKINFGSSPLYRVVV
ncbi:unnamed protein product, partial [Allacma fusca]